jgi:hypothetical protein
LEYSPRLRNSIIDAFFNIVRQNSEVLLTEPKTVDCVYRETMPGSTLRRIFGRLFLFLDGIPEDDDMDL